MMALDRLQRSRILRGFSEEEITQITALGAQTQYTAGQTIFHEGDQGHYLYLVIDGSVSIHCGDKCIARCRVYDAFGEMGVFRQTRRSATARAATDVTLLQLDDGALNSLLSGPLAVQFLLNVVNVLSERLEAGNMWIASSLEAQRQRD